MMAPQLAMASVPRRTVRLRPSSGRSFRTTAKPNSSASAAAPSYCVTTVTQANSSRGTASSARRSSVFPSITASSLLRPKRLPLPAAITRQPMRSSAMPSPSFLPCSVSASVCPVKTRRIVIHEIKSRPPCTFCALCAIIPMNT